ncbi:NAD(P)-dependent oxidoreductase [Azotobacter beijerinckii]|uniref:3-hydroxyisobutyrate dehydrogenase n=1 Tax=Azotobacter beijerinckii TaxID=170623 RepID=A0A1I4A5J1_9GAMM|nr:NAD(P)-dependent oxidoreductase [Azotobacter beijerinckii]SFA88086.1 3-hydroxyisobutyrate dehydrogenase [Azotobacter beijerinckii]SFK51618.1 3-hydroxyisobutyrate dehydrogenase [Azotobacter beijerinckii]
MLTTLSLIGFGEAGAIFGEDLVALGVTVYAYDRLQENPSTRAALYDKARRCGVQLCDSFAQAVALGDWVISAVTADAALEVAQAAAALMKPSQLFIDINSVAPSTKRTAFATMHSYGIGYIDAAVMAPVPPQRLKTPILLGGEAAALVAEQLAELGMNVRRVADEVGVASAIKMCRSIMIKGLEALTTECLSTARQYQAEREVLASLHQSFPHMGWEEALPHYLISRVAEHGRRRSEEMKEVAKTSSDMGVVPNMSLAIVNAQRGLVDAMNDADLDYATLEPFDWLRLIDTLYGRPFN